MKRGCSQPASSVRLGLRFGRDDPRSTSSTLIVPRASRYPSDPFESSSCCPSPVEEDLRPVSPSSVRFSSGWKGDVFPFYFSFQPTSRSDSNPRPVLSFLPIHEGREPSPVHLLLPSGVQRTLLRFCCPFERDVLIGRLEGDFPLASSQMHVASSSPPPRRVTSTTRASEARARARRSKA